jgi:hypothetical protein
MHWEKSDLASLQRLITQAARARHRAELAMYLTRRSAENLRRAREDAARLREDAAQLRHDAASVRASTSETMERVQLHFGGKVYNAKSARSSW